MTAEQLKKSILQMAVQGKLVPQDPNDEPASVLLSRIREEKEKLIKDGKIKKEKNPSVIFRGEDNLPYEKIGNNEPKCIADEVPFEIPESWEWIRFKNLVNYSMGKTPPRKEETYWVNPLYPWVSIADMIDGNYIKSTKEKVNQYSFDNLFKKNIIPSGTLIMSFKLTVGKVSILGMDAFHNEAIISIFPYIIDKNIIRDFLFEALPLLSQLGKTKTAIKGNTLNSESLDMLMIPLPPLNEQLRIINKINELKPFIIKYNNSETKLLKLETDFPELLKKSILQQAVMGKLVPQNPNDEPASVLVERIREEKQALIKAGKLKKDKNESIIYRRDNSHYEKVGGDEQCIDNVLPFEIPNSWEWVHLNNVAKSELGKTIDKSKNTGNPKPYLCSINIHWYDIDLKKTKYALFENEELIKYKLLPNDLLICEGGDVGRSAIWKENIEMYYQNALHRVRFFDRIEPEYFLIVLEFFKLDGTIIKYAKGMTIKHLVQKALNEIYFPIPPIDEQKKIILKYKKINDLLSLFAI